MRTLHIERTDVCADRMLARATARLVDAGAGARLLRLSTAVLGMATAACERVVDVQLPDGEVRLVVEARLERVQGRVSGNQAITLRTTAPYFSNTAAPAARGARVTVIEEGGRAVTFSESSTTPGRYITSDLVVQRGRVYRLQIDYQNQRYESVDTARSVAPIDDLYFDKPKPGRFAGTEGVRATIDLRDPADERNFYLWDQFVDGVRQLGPDTAFKMRLVAPDDVFDGVAVIGFQPFEGIDIPQGSTVLLRQIGISEEIYRYYFALSDQVGADGSVFSVPPSSVRGNVANRTTPARYPLGYFYVSEVSEASRRR